MVARWSRTLVWALLIQAAAGASVAAADGLPVLGIEGSSQGVRSLDGTASYVTRRAGRDTRVLRRSGTGHVIIARRLTGRLVVPVVAYDGTSAGLSADGRTLVLIRPRTRFPQSATALAILAPGGLQVRSRISLRGDFSFDAISPNGRWIYLIQYTSAADPTRYRVRALDVRSGHLLRGAIVDPHDRAEAMHGAPVTRVGSSDGRWAYTLYDGGGHPFVHALDTTDGTARCLDLPGNLDAWSARLRLSAGDARLWIDAHHRTAAMIDTRTLAVSVPAAAVTAKSRLRPGERGGVGGLGLALAAIVMLPAAALVIRRRSGRALAPAQAP
jgi:hypothetical protein